MVQVYVTEMPKKESDCPFFMDTNKKCNICKNKCNLNTNKGCEHLLTLLFGFNEEAENGESI